MEASRCRPAASEIGPSGQWGAMRGVVGLGHAGDQARLEDAAAVGDVGLQNGGGTLFQNFAEAPLGEDALAGGDGQMGLARQIGQHIHILALDRLFDEERLIGLQRLDEQAGRLRADRAVEVDGDVDLVAHGLADGGKAFGSLLHKAGRLDDARRPRPADAGLDGDKALGDRILGVLDRTPRCVRPPMPL